MNWLRPFWLVWARLTFNWITIAYTVNALIYCTVQVMCQVCLWNMNLYAGDLGKAIIAQTNISQSAFVSFNPDLNTLRLCANNTAAMNPDPMCSLFWESQARILAVDSSMQELDVSGNREVEDDPEDGDIQQVQLGRGQTKRSIELEGVIDPDTSLVTFVRITGLHGDPNASGSDHQQEHATDTTLVSLACVQAIKWPTQIVLQGKREDIVYTAFQIWVLGMSLVAVLNESIPHIFVAYFTHFIAMAWSSYQLAETATFQEQYMRAVVNGACHGVDIFPDYFGPRQHFELAMTIVHIASLFTSGWLTYKLFYLFGWVTFKRMGASVVINRVYKLALTLSILIQLGLFFIVVTMGLWIDQLYSGIFAPFANHTTVYKSLFIIAFCVLPPWLILGWFAVRRENRGMMIVFLLVCVFLIGGAIGSTFSTSFRLTFTNWIFFGVMCCAAFTCLVLTTINALLCRLNFGKGLIECLQAARVKEGRYGSEDSDDEGDSPFKPTPDVIAGGTTFKIAFPSLNNGLKQFPFVNTPAQSPDKRSFYQRFQIGRTKAGGASDSDSTAITLSMASDLEKAMSSRTVTPQSFASHARKGSEVPTLRSVRSATPTLHTVRTGTPSLMLDSSSISRQSSLQSHPSVPQKHRDDRFLYSDPDAAVFEEYVTEWDHAGRHENDGSDEESRRESGYASYQKRDSQGTIASFMSPGLADPSWGAIPILVAPSSNIEPKSPATARQRYWSARSPQPEDMGDAPLAVLAHANMPYRQLHQKQNKGAKKPDLHPFAAATWSSEGKPRGWVIE